MNLDSSIQALFQRQGWREAIESNLPLLDDDNSTTRSGKYFNVDYHPLVTIKNIHRTQNINNISSEIFNRLLKELQLKSIRNALYKLFPVNILQSQTLLTTESGNEDVYTIPANHFVGVSIRFCEKRNLSMLIKQVGLFMNGADNFQLYLFHSSQNDPINTFNVTSTEKSEVYTSINESLYSFSQTIKGGTYYLGYYTKDISTQPIRRDGRKRKNRFVDIDFIQVPTTTETMFDTDDVQTTSKEWLNLEASYYNDYSSLIIDNESQFDEVIGKQVALEALRIMYSSTRSNNTERELDQMQKQRIFFDMNGNKSNPNYPYSTGMITEVDNEMKRLKNRFFPKNTLTVNTLR